MHRTAGIAALVALTTFSAVPAQATQRPPREITATVETPSLFDDEAGGDADADDPAIWINRADKRRSLVIGTAKNGGLRVYDLTGREVQAIATPEGGRFNNVDVLTGFKLGKRTVDLAVVTDRGLDKLRIYKIEASGLTDITAANVPLLFAKDEAEVEEQATGYGLALYDRYAVVSRRHSTRLGIFRLEEKNGKVTYRTTDTLDLPRQFRLPNGTSWAPCGEPGEDPQVEGMVVDAEAGVLYAAQEDVALWRIDLKGGHFSSVPRIVERVAEFGVPATFDPESEECILDTANDPGFGGRITADVEGATIYPTGRRDGYVIVSSQGDSRFFVYDRRTNRPVKVFSVTDGSRVDGVQHSDGAAATAVSLPGYPKGLLVLHDGENKPDDGRVSTNFKFVDWRSLNLS
ncbi:putative phytase [Actinoplanes missouriensis 431]|uniref:Putative phytase n=1 Tax=Actinoplanes missouriensis (strain ATCC 14538 / DSM 43046 / CBS 188.64 / JCM 3121 / NBRC 102363 / NCIMB 12654 / NRRL B-3342 / UNCC 431) TaxID=512565 RepID=I0GX85_ACTM4|nr:phytase [Actinoplanes missouriensis]BAL85372.1 putative phytase [Actinoplanes missouriensis 431]